LFTAAAAVFVEVAKRRTLRDIKFAADAMPYILNVGLINLRTIGNVLGSV
jgi:hypothetical protein